MNVDYMLKDLSLKVACVKIAEGIDNLKQLGFTDEQIVGAVKKQLHEAYNTQEV